MSGIVGQVGSKSTIIGSDGRIGASCRMWLTSTISSKSSGQSYITGYTQAHNDDTAVFTQGSTSTNGITLGVAGWYKYDIMSYTYSHTSDGYMTVMLGVNATSTVDDTYTIRHFVDAESPDYNSHFRSGTLYLATNTYGIVHNHSGGTCTLQGGVAGGVTITLTYLRA